MTTRDPRSRAFRTGPTGAPGDGGREPTQSLDLDAEDASPELAAGTADRSSRPSTRVASPSGRDRPPARPSDRFDDALEYLGAVLGSYRIAELLGKGGMGYVFRAEHVKLGREVALKLLRADYASRRDAVARFFQEARTVNRVRHRNIVDVTDFVELDDGTTFIIMELLTGDSLGSWARTGIDLPRALAVLIQICDGLGAAHQVGVIHRDLKPDNVIVVPTADGAELVKLLDFGVAKLVNRDDEDVGFETAAGSVIGTPAYMSPEQAGGMMVDARSDIYSLGAIMYELFCGQPMFRGRSFGEYVRKHLTEQPLAPRHTAGGAGIDRELEAVILRCLDKDPDQRFGHIFELRDALLARLGGMVTQPPTVMAPRSQLPTLFVPAPAGQLSQVSGGAPAYAAPLPYSAQLGQVSQVSQVSGLSASAQLSAVPASAPPSRLEHPSQISGLSDPSQISGVSSAQHGLAHGYSALHGYPPPPAATPWWLWLVGGALAVGVGVGAAVWYAGRRAPAPRPAAALAAIAPPPPPVGAEPAHPLIELRFDSLPSGGVYADGRSVELCRTPCAFNLDLADGGPADRRTFLVKREGYRDGAVTVDLTGARREFRVLLEQVPAPAVAEPAPAVAEPVRNEPRPERRPAKRTAKPRPVREPRDAHAHLIDPSDDKPVPTRRSASPAIDPADTLDPFRHK